MDTSVGTGSIPETDPMTKFLAFVGLLAILGAIAAATYLLRRLLQRRWNRRRAAVRLTWALAHVRDCFDRAPRQRQPPAVAR